MSTDDNRENPWTGVNYRHVKPIPRCGPGSLQANDKLGFRIFIWLREAFVKFSSKYVIELPKYLPLNSDFKISRTKTGEQILCELKSSDMCWLEELGKDRFMIKHRQYHSGDREKIGPIFSEGGGRWTYILTVPENISYHDSQFPPRRFLLIHRKDVPQQWFGSSEEELAWPTSLTMTEIREKFLVDPHDLSAMVAQVEILLDRHEFNCSSFAYVPLEEKGQLDGVGVEDSAISGAADIAVDGDDAATVEADIPEDDDIKDVTATPSTDFVDSRALTQHQTNQPKRFLIQCRRR